MAETYDYVVVGLGALGSAAAFRLARRGHRVLGLERFELGHARGASHDTSRILRHSYHTPAYVAATKDAYDDWAALEADTGELFVTEVGGLDLFPDGGLIPIEDYTGSLDAEGVEYELLSAEEVTRRWPQFALDPDVVGLYQARSSIVPAARATRAMQREAERHGAALRDRCAVTALVPDGAGWRVETEDRSFSCGGVVVTADAWSAALLEPLGVSVPLTVTLEQATYFSPPDPSRFAPDRTPLWIWMDGPCFYGFPTYGEPTVKAAEDVGGPAVDPDDRTSKPDPVMLDRLASHVRRMLPGAGEPVRSLRCQYALTPDRDFVLDIAAGLPPLAIGLGAGHGFKFAPWFGRVLADLVTEGAPRPTRHGVADLSAYRLGRPALTDSAYPPSWLV